MEERSRSVLRVARDLTVVILIAVLAWRLATVEVSVTEFEFADLLSVLLALFAVALSAAFYFRTTETSNRFYDNSFRFTKDISETLGRIEERFGERLKHIDESYSGLHARLVSAESVTEGTAAEIAEEKEVLRNIIEQRDELVEQLLARAQLSQEEQTKIRERLIATEEELEAARTQLATLDSEFRSARRRELQLRDQLAAAEGLTRGGSSDALNHPFPGWFQEWLDREFAHGDLVGMHPDEAMRELQNLFEERVGSQPYEDAIHLGYYDPKIGWLAPARRWIMRARAKTRGSVLDSRAST